MNDVWNFMIYDAFGKLVAEYGGVSSPSVSAGPNISYIQQDWQGSVRTVSNSNGFIINRTDYSAFGESIGNGVGLRSTAQGYWGTTTTRRGYGLTEQDDATGLDHTWFRKNERAAGRWTSPDPYKGSMSLGDPQTFNRYSYVVNQPTNFVDPSGLLFIQICQPFALFYINDDGSRGDIIPNSEHQHCQLIYIGGDPSPQNGPAEPPIGPGQPPTGAGESPRPSDREQADYNNCILNLLIQEIGTGVKFALKILAAKELFGISALTVFSTFYFGAVTKSVEGFLHFIGAGSMASLPTAVFGAKLLDSAFSDLSGQQDRIRNGIKDCNDRHPNAQQLAPPP